MTDFFIGTDLVAVARIQSAINKSGERFINRIYTPIEQDYCQSKANPEVHFAGRFAAKEAVMKALKSSGMNDPIPFSSIEIQSSDNGEPLVVLEMKMEGHCRVSISHTESYAIAFAIYNPK